MQYSSLFKLGSTLLLMAAPMAGGLLGAKLTMKDVKSSWYQQDLQKPSWNPPNWVFGPVWTILYLMIGWSSVLIVYAPSHPAKTAALGFYGAQLFLNWIYSPIFFHWRNLKLASIEIVAMFALICKTMVEFQKINPTAALLLVPYALWVGFASILTITITALNWSSKPKKE